MRLITGSVLILSACWAAPPVWYANGRTTWTIPLVDPAAPALVVEAKIHDKGPYLFLLDPDAPFSIIDDRVATDLKLYSDQQYFRMRNQNDVTLPRKAYEVLSLQAGELHARNVVMANAPAGSLSVNGRQIHGIIGSELLSRTIVIHVDRDRGQVQLALTGKQTIPEGAVAIEGSLRHGAFYVPVRLDGGRTVELRLKLASSVSTLKRDVIEELSAPRLAATATLIDETGTRATLPGGVVMPAVQLDGLSIRDVEFFGHVDRRDDLELYVHGILGENLLSRFNVVVDRDKSTLWLAPRRQPSSELVSAR